MDVNRHKLWIVVWIATLFGLGCKAPQACCDPHMVSRQLTNRTGMEMHSIPPGQTRIPSSVQLLDGLDEDEAVLTALSNNSAFQGTLAQLGAVGGDAVQATLLANPQFLTYFPSGAKEGQYTLYAPIAMHRSNRTCSVLPESKLPIESTTGLVSNWSKMDSI